MNYTKIFGCNIHGLIKISNVALKIIDSPEFQRLRHIKQLGVCEYVFPSATHTRFEHSLGVYYLAGKVVDKIRLEYPNRKFQLEHLGEVCIDPIIGECIKIAGLCHDIGHGPFSHIFDDTLLKNSESPNKTHETRSCLLIDLIYQRELKTDLTENHIKFIKNLINPEKQHVNAIYQIISNSVNNIDVDKFDYLIRDSINLGFGKTFDPLRIIDGMMIDSNDNIAYPEHYALDIYSMFHSRYMMHKKVYQHKTVKIIETMLKDIFIRIDKIFCISDMISNMENFCSLNDDSLFNYLKLLSIKNNCITLNLTSEQKQLLTESMQIYDRLLHRKLYKRVFVGENNDETQKIIEQNYSNQDYEIIKTDIGYVNSYKQNPFNFIYFYQNKNPSNTFILNKTDISGLMNDQISEIKIHVLFKN